MYDSPIDTAIRTGHYHAVPNAPLPSSSVKKNIKSTANMLIDSSQHVVDYIRNNTTQRQIDRQEAVMLFAAGHIDHVAIVIFHAMLLRAA